MKNIFVPVAVMLAASLSVYGQTDQNRKPGDPFAPAKTTTMEDDRPKTYYSIVNADPYYKRTSLILDPFVIGVGAKTGLASALRLESVVTENVMVWGKVTKTWIGEAGIGIGYEDAPVAVGGMKNHMFTEAGGAFFVINDAFDAKVKVVTKSGRSGSVHIDYYINVPSKVRRMLGVRAGHLTQRRQILVNDDSRDDYYYTSADGVYKVPVLKEHPANIYIRKPAGDYFTAVGVSNTNSAFAGVHFRKVKNTTIILNDNTTRTTDKLIDVYADVLITYYNNIRNLVDIKGVEWGLVAHDGVIRKMGWRAGCAIRLPVRGYWQANVELGKWPGPKLQTEIGNTGFFTLIGIGRSIGLGRHGLPPKAPKTDDKK